MGRSSSDDDVTHCCIIVESINAEAEGSPLMLSRTADALMSRDAVFREGCFRFIMSMSCGCSTRGAQAGPERRRPGAAEARGAAAAAVQLGASEGHPQDHRPGLQGPGWHARWRLAHPSCEGFFFALCCFMLYMCPVPISQCLEAQVMARGTAMRWSEPYGKCSGHLSMLAAVAGFWCTDKCTPVQCCVSPAPWTRHSRSACRASCQPR